MFFFFSLPCKRRLLILLCAFSNSSNRIIVYGFRNTASVKRPPSSYPTYLQWKIGREGEKEEEGKNEGGTAKENEGIRIKMRENDGERIQSYEKTKETEGWKWKK